VDAKLDEVDDENVESEIGWACRSNQVRSITSSDGCYFDEVKDARI
jgi:hypothetical protein